MKLHERERTYMIRNQKGKERMKLKKKEADPLMGNPSLGSHEE